MKGIQSRQTAAWLDLLWLGFALLWFQTGHITTAREAITSVRYLGGLNSVYAVVIAWWIYHNVRIYRKKGPRRGLREFQFLATHDLLQHEIWRQTDVEHVQEINVTVIGDRKLFMKGVRPNPLPLFDISA